MKKSILLIIFALIFMFCGCMVNIPLPEITTMPDETELAEVSSVERQSQEHTNGSVFESVSYEDASDTTVASEETTSEEISSEEVVVTVESSSVDEEATSEESTTVAHDITQVDLSIEMPEKNGSMQTDSSPDNKFIEIVKNERKIDDKLLVAVFSVPDTGQNYVFEFKNADNRSADNIRRVYLIDEKGKITSVAADNSAEKENVSSVENWFCMNVLIKEVIYPAIEQEISR